MYNVCSSGGDSNDDGWVDYVGGVDTNGCDGANCDDGDSNLACSDDADGGYGDDKEDNNVDDDVDSNIFNDDKCDDDKSKVKWS